MTTSGCRRSAPGPPAGIEYIINVNRCRSEEKGYFEMSNLFPFSNVSRQFKYYFVVVAETDTSCHLYKKTVFKCSSTNPYIFDCLK